MESKEVYLGLGGNVGDTYANLQRAFHELANLPNVTDFKASRIYKTTPAYNTAQPHYLNAVCRFKSALEIHELLHRLQLLEKQFGQPPRARNSPRILDIDILFFGQDRYEEPNLQIPHPRWKERLFVLAPLSDLVTTLTLPDPESPGKPMTFSLPEYLKTFENPLEETVVLYQEKSHA